MRCIDEKLWDEMKECFVQDATCAYGGGKYSFSGRDEIMKFLIESMDRKTFLSSHRVHHPEIEFTSDTTATGIWALEDYVIDEENEITIRGAAFYRDKYVKVNGKWKIIHIGYTRTFEEIESRKGNERLQITQRLAE